MSKFVVGDKVLITVMTIPNTGLPIKAGTEGEVVTVDNTQTLQCCVKYKNDHGSCWWFADNQLVLTDSNSMPELDMGLDEIHLAQEIMEGLR